MHSFSLLHVHFPCTRCSCAAPTQPKPSKPDPVSRVSYEEEEGEEPKRSCPEIFKFDPRPLSERVQTDSPRDDPLVQTLGFSAEEIRLLSKASQTLSKFSVKNIQKPWLSQHCNLLGKDKVVAVLKEALSTLHTKGRKSRGGRS